MVECCKRWYHRLYYSIMTGMYVIILTTQLVALGTFGVQLSLIDKFHDKHVNDASVCVLYGKKRDSSSPLNVRLTNNSSCGFTLWALVTTVLVLLVWIVGHVIMAIIGKPKILSPLRIPDLVMTSSIGFLSLIISSVLTNGLKETCRNVEMETTCPNKRIRALHGEEEQSFFPNLNSAMDSSWVVTILIFILIIWYALVVFVTFFKMRRNHMNERARKEAIKEAIKEEARKEVAKEEDKEEETSEINEPISPRPSSPFGISARPSTPSSVSSRQSIPFSISSRPSIPINFKPRPSTPFSDT